MKFNRANIEKWNDWMLPLCFTLAPVINFMFFYLGLALQENTARRYGFIIGSVLFAVCCGLSFLSILKDRKLTGCTLILLCGALAYFVICYVARIYLFGIEERVLYAVSQFVVFCVTSFLCGVCSAIRRNEREFFENMEKMTFLVLPAAIIYTNSAIFQCNPYNWGRDFGIIDYMSFSYTLMPFLLVHIIRFADKERMWLPIINRYAQKPQLVRGGLIGLYWFTILAAGTRGTYFCVCGFCILFVLSRILHKQSVKTTIWVSGSIIGLLLFTMFVYTLPGLKGVGSMTEFVDGLKDGKLVTTRGEDSDVDNHLDELVAENGGTQITNRPTDSQGTTEPGTTEPGTTEPGTTEPGTTEPGTTEPGTTEPGTTEPGTTEPGTTEPGTTEPGATEPGTTEPEEPQKSDADIADANLQIGNRGTMFKLAFKEFLKSPLTGMGPGGYGVKYGGYPHNAILEILCETGIIGTVILVGFLLIAAIKMILVGCKQREVRYIFLFFLAYGIQANISGSIWYCAPLMCALGYGLTLPIKKGAEGDIGE